MTGLRVALALACAIVAAPARARADESAAPPAAGPPAPAAPAPVLPAVQVNAAPEHAATAAACRDAVVTAAPMLAALWPLRPGIERPLVIHLPPTAAAYRDHVVAAGAPALARYFAATLDRTGESVVMIQPRATLDGLVPVRYLPELLHHLVVHEVVHQWARVAGIAAAPYWPAWYAEGLADAVGARAVIAARPAGTARPLSVDDRRWLMLDALRAGRAIPLRRLLHAQATSVDDIRTLYAHACSFVEFLSADGDRMRALHAAMAAIEVPAGGWSDRVLAVETAAAAAVERVFGPLDALERSWHDRVRETRPVWAEPWRSVQEIAPGTFLALPFPEESALALRVEPPPRGGYSISGRVRPATDAAQADLVCAAEGTRPARFLRIALRGDGTASLLAFADGHWQHRYRVVAALPANGERVDGPAAFRLTVSARSLRLALDGEDVAEFDIPPGFDAVGGRWGIGASDGPVAFSDLVVAALAPR